MSNPVAWIIASAAEYGIAFAALKVLWLISLLLVRRRKDKLRAPFLWLKWAISLYLLFVALELVVQGLNIYLFETGYSSEPLLTTDTHIANIAPFIDQIADIFMLLCLVELNLSSLRALGSFNQQGIRYCNFVILAVLTILAIATLGENESWVVKSDDGTNEVSWATAARIYCAYTIVWWITSLPIIALSISVLSIAYRRQRMRWIARRLFVVSILNFVRCTWELYYSARYLIKYSNFELIPQYTGVLEPILYTWFTVIMVGLLVAIGIKKNHGLWTEQCLQQAPGVVQYQPTATGRGAGVYGGEQGYPTAPVPPVAQYQAYQQPQQSELVGNYAPIWRPELAAMGQNQQQYWGQQQQQPMGTINPVSPQSPEKSPQSYYTQEMDGAPGRGSILRRPTPHEMHNTQVYEAGGG